MKLAAAALAALLAAPAPAVATDATTVAVPSLDFTDGSGEVRDQAADHARRVAALADTLRTGLAAAGVSVAVPDCGNCSPARTPFPEMAAAARAVDADLLLVGNVHKISTLISTLRLTLLDLPGDRIVCARTLSFRGDDDRSWQRAAGFAVGDVLAHCQLR